MSTLDIRLISSALEDVAMDPKANVRPADGTVGGFPTLASWLFEIRRDLLELSWKSVADAAQARQEIVYQLEAAANTSPIEAQRIRAIRDRVKEVML